MQSIEIPFSKPKILMMFGGCAFIAAVLVVLLIQDDIGLIRAFLVAPMALLTGFVAWFSFCKWVEKQPALVIDDEGIIDNSNALSVGRIEWGQIQKFTVNWKFRSLAVELKDPQYFIQSQKNPLKKLVMQLNWKYDSSPIHINDQLLSMKIEAVLQEIKSRQMEGMPFNDFLKHLVD